MLPKSSPIGRWNWSYMSYNMQNLKTNQRLFDDTKRNMLSSMYERYYENMKDRRGRKKERSPDRSQSPGK